MRRRKLLIGLALAAIVALLGGLGARLLAAHRLRVELAEARTEIDSGLLATARLRLTRLAERWPADGEVAYELGRCEASRGRFEAALESWGRVAGDSRWASDAAIEFAEVAIQLGRVVEAERVLRAALARPGPKVPALRHLLVILLGQQGRHDEARRMLESFWSAPASLPAGDLDGRLALLREHAEIDFETFPLEWNLSILEGGSTPVGEDDRLALAIARAYMAWRSGEFDRAESLLRDWLGRRPDDPALGKAWLEWAVAAGRVEVAREALDHLPAGRIDDARHLELRAWVARERHDLPAERPALEALLALEPGRPTAMARLAELLQRAGDLRGAAELRRRKAEFDAAQDRYFQLYKENNYRDHVRDLAELAERLGRTFEARGFWELIRDRSPDDPAARSALARLGSGAKATPTHIEAEAASAPVSTAPARHRGASRAPLPRFEDLASTSGLADFIQDNGVSPIHQLPEMASGGVGLLDYDGDGRLDVYCVQGGTFPPGPDATRSGDRLFRNRGDGTFEDVTRPSGIGGMRRGYGHGVSVGDYDNDGRPDLFVTRWRSYALYRNRGDGTFEDVTEQAGLAGDRDWPTSSAFADLDGDGDLDLYVCHYGRWDPANPLICKDPSGAITLTCDPRRIASLPDHVFRNDRGRFVDVTAEAGIVDRDGRGFGVVAADLDEDGRIDLFVANDSTANFLFRNLGGFRFEEVGHEAGVAANAGGGYQAGMGVACGDLDGDGHLDLAVTNFYAESTSLFRNLGHGFFADHTAAVGLSAPSRHRLGFGAAFLDADADGWLDLLTVNGHISDIRPLFPFAMRPQLFRGGPDGALTDVTDSAGPPFQRAYVGRGLAVGDLDNDGRQDAVFVAQNEPLVDLRNKTDGPRGHFVTFQPEGTASNRDGVGAVVAIRAEGRTRVAPRLGGGSFQSASDPRVHFGLGPCDRVEWVEVRWPSGRVDRHPSPDVDRGHLLREGDARLKPLPGFSQ